MLAQDASVLDAYDAIVASPGSPYTDFRGWRRFGMHANTGGRFLGREADFNMLC